MGECFTAGQAVTGNCSLKKVFLTISQNSEANSFISWIMPTIVLCNFQQKSAKYLELSGQRIHFSEWFYNSFVPIDISLFKIDSGNTRIICKICLKLTIETPEQRHWPRSSDVFNVNLE